MMAQLITIAALSALRIDSYPNAALFGLPKTGSISSLDFTHSNFTSAEVSGQVHFAHDAFYAFDCAFAGGQLVFVWIDDHLVCHTNPPFSNSPSSTDGSAQNPIAYKSGDKRHILIHIYSTATSSDAASVRVSWAPLKMPLAVGVVPSYIAIPPSALSADSSALELQRRSLQKKLASGWNLWGYNLLGIAKLPHSCVLTTALCQLSSGKCLRETRIEDTAAQVRVGPYAIDQSYWQLYVGYQGVNVSLSVAGGSGALHVLVEPLHCATKSNTHHHAAESTNCSDYTLVVEPRFMWYRPGGVDVIAEDGTITFTPIGFKDPLVIRPTAKPTLANTSSATFALGDGPVGLVEGSSGTKAPTIASVQKVISHAREKELATYGTYGALSELKEAVQAATMWNYIYNPAEYGPILPVSRSWNFVKSPANSDWK